VSKIVEISSYFPSKSNFKKSATSVVCQEHQVLVDYLTQYAYKHSNEGLYKTYTFLTSKEAIAAYISFSITNIEGSDAKSYLDVPIGLNYPIPALKITRLLTSDEYTNLGIATRLLFLADILAFLLSNQIGCKAIVVDAKKDAVSFYERNGFDILNSEADTTETLLMIKKVDTLKEYGEDLHTILDQFINFCNDYELRLFKPFLETIKQ